MSREIHCAVMSVHLLDDLLIHTAPEIVEDLTNVKFGRENDLTYGFSQLVVHPGKGN